MMKKSLHHNFKRTRTAIGRPIGLFLCALLWSAGVMAQPTVQGTVVDMKGQPVIGAAIVVEGTTIGTTSDGSGKFTIRANNGDKLQISFVGYETRLVEAYDQVRIVLEEDSRTIDEVVVVGYGTQSRRNFTGSVSTVKLEDDPVSLIPRTNIADVLRGTATGITVGRELGAGSEQSMLIHGQKSLASGSNEPLIVLDGVIFMGRMQDIDPPTIESISVLKDATSLAAYGSQAANGVIMITSKKGKIGKPVVTFDISAAFSEVAIKPKYLSPEMYVIKTNQAFDLPSDADPVSWMKGFEYENWLAGNTTDWLDYVTRTGVLQNYSGSVSGATERLNYYVSASHTEKKSMLKGDQYSREAFTMRIQSDITKWFQLGTQMNYTYSNYDGIAADISGHISPYGRPERPDGGLEKWPIEGGTSWTNPLWNTLEGHRDDYQRHSNIYMKAHALVKCPWIDGLSYRFNVTYSTLNYMRDSFTHESYYVKEGNTEDRYSPAEVAKNLVNANGSSNRRLTNYWVMDQIVNYTKQFGHHFFDATFVYTRDSRWSSDRTMVGRDYSELGNSLLGYNGLSYAKVKDITALNNSKKNNVGYLGRLNYNYDNRYHLSVSVRHDGSSVFGSENKWGTFPAVGAAWTVSREEFMKNVTLIDNLKIKASWGKNGNQTLSPYGTLTRINLGQVAGNGYLFGNSSVPSWAQTIGTPANPELGWETTTAINAGFEIELLNNRIHLEFDTYKSKTTDQIFSRKIPVMGSGHTEMSATMGRIDNWGIEIVLNTVNLKTTDFMWTSMLTFYLNRNKLVDLYGDGNDDIANARFLGKSLGAIYGYKAIGIVQEDDIEYMAANNKKPGDVKFANIDGSPDGLITPDDRTILGYDKENFRMSLGNTLTYKKLELYFLLTGTFGGNGWGQAVNRKAYISEYDNKINNQLAPTWWTPENRSNKYPAISGNTVNFDPIMGYGFVRLQNLSLSYRFTQPGLKQIGISNMRVYVAIKNLFTITNWVGGDPEIKQTGTNHFLERSYSLGVNFSF